LALNLFQDQQDTPVFASVFDTRRENALWQTDITSLDHHALTLGVEYGSEKLDTNQAYVDDQRHNKAVFLQDVMNYGIHSLQLGLRHDDNSQYGIEKTWNINYGLALSDYLSLFGSYGTAFKAPAFNDLYFPYTDYCSGFGFICASVGNPDLDAEHSRSFELGLRGSNSRHHWVASVYRTNIKNLITWTQFFGPGPFDSTWRPANVNDAVIEGMDLSGGMTVNDWKIQGTLTLLNPQDADTGERLIRRSKRKASLDIDRQLTDQLSMGLSWMAQGGRMEGMYYLGGYNTVDIRGIYRPLDSLTLTLTLQNIFDNNYHLARGYETYGASALLTAAYTF
jgi:vitamin B12 transporter